MRTQILNRRDRIALIASVALALYSIGRILQSITFALAPYQPAMRSLGQRSRYFLSSSVESWVLLAMAACGLVLVFAEGHKDQETAFPDRFAKISKTVYSIFLILTVGSIFRFLNWTIISYQSVQVAVDAGVYTNSFGIPFLAVSILGVVFGALNICGRTLFGIYLLNQSEKLIKPLIITSLAGFAYTLISRTYTFVRQVLYYTNLFADATRIIEFGQPDTRISSAIFSYTGHLLVLAASLIILLYGLKNRIHSGNKTQ
jgi:hypothetical protein